MFVRVWFTRFIGETLAVTVGSTRLGQGTCDLKISTSCPPTLPDFPLITKPSKYTTAYTQQ
jgi:hypothetical protein